MAGGKDGHVGPVHAMQTMFDGHPGFYGQMQGMPYPLSLAAMPYNAYGGGAMLPAQPATMEELSGLMNGVSSSFVNTNAIPNVQVPHINGPSWRSTSNGGFNARNGYTTKYNYAAPATAPAWSMPINSYAGPINHAVMPYIAPVAAQKRFGVHWQGDQPSVKEITVADDPRRTSLSSAEGHGPQTPYWTAHGLADGKSSATGRSPPATNFTTPSPQSSGHGSQPEPLMKKDGHYVPVDYDKVCGKEPAIPKPIPAIFSDEKNGRGTLAKSLVNDRHTTNVYIRGLHPNTTDEKLTKYGARFGDIVSAKSMLDQSTGLCKGFGFIKYHNFDDGENCIRGFFHLGYEAKWARQSHNEKLKTLSDEHNTNLYISNLPLDFNENMLMAVFEGQECLSAKILRDDNGMSRGVGFARFSSAEICNSIIEKYNNKTVADYPNVISVRYADTPDQKKLKSETAMKRQFKANEYNAAAFGPGSPYASPVSATFPSPMETRVPSQRWFPGVNSHSLPVPLGVNVAKNSVNVPVTRVTRAVSLETTSMGKNKPRRASVESPSSAATARRSEAAKSTASRSASMAAHENRWPASPTKNPRAEKKTSFSLSDTDTNAATPVPLTSTSSNV